MRGVLTGVTAWLRGLHWPQVRLHRNAVIAIGLVLLIGTTLFVAVVNSGNIASIGGGGSVAVSTPTPAPSPTAAPATTASPTSAPAAGVATATPTPTGTPTATPSATKTPTATTASAATPTPSPTPTPGPTAAPTPTPEPIVIGPKEARQVTVTSSVSPLIVLTGTFKGTDSTGCYRIVFENGSKRNDCPGMIIYLTQEEMKKFRLEADGPVTVTILTK